MHVHVSCRKNYTRTPGVPASSAEIFDRKTMTASRGLNFIKDCFYCGYVITERKKKTNHVISLVITERLIKQSTKLSLAEKMMSAPLKLREALVLRINYMQKTQCSIQSVVQVFGLVKVIQRKVLWRKNEEEIQLQTKKQCSKSSNISSLTQLSRLILQLWEKWWKNSWVVIMFYIWFEQTYCGDQRP